MKILSLNTWNEIGSWRERWEIIFKGLEALKPDLVAFQEVFNASWAGEMHKRSGYKSLVFREEPSGLCFLSRYPVKNSSGVTYSASSVPEACKRYALHAEFETPAGPLHFFNTHFSWRLEESEIRQKQAEEFLAFVRTRAGNETVVAAGDFNTVAWTPEIRKITDAGLRDVFREANPRDPGITWAYDNPYARASSHPLPDRRIDYLFARDGAKPILRGLRHATIVFNRPDSEGHFASDHFGVLAEFEG